MGGMGMAQSGKAPKKTVRSLMVGTKVKFRSTKGGPKISSMKSPNVKVYPGTKFSLK